MIMRHWLNIACLFVLCAFVESCGMDDYPEPGETLEGAVIDCFTNEPIVTEQPNGYRIKMEDIGWSDNSVPWYFWGKADGTFQNTFQHIKPSAVQHIVVEQPQRVRP